MNTPVSLNGDIPVGNWIDRWIPAPARPYLRLMRLDRPIGTWLLLFPCWWSSALAADGWPDIRLFILFAVGAVVMRGAGCTVNDIADHKFDALVARTAGRPIPSGAVSVPQAVAFLALQLLAGLVILLQLPPFAIMVGAASLLLVFPYPLMKRITWWPQAWLGLTFNWGALLGWAAVTGEIGPPALVLYAAGILWTLGYDTIYAHQDKEDDIMVGIKSTALRLGDSTPAWLIGFYGGTLALVGLACWLAGLSWAFWPGLALAGLQLAWQVRTVDIDDGADCLDKFKSNRFFGWALLAAIIAGKLT
ncbi:4-hydroxybenzoate polyprenyltransferase [Magnetospirillum sp. LM-5]|uniref:4-hydroxybenzoate octaprenyltransferase n=1 Tax=Magnetospirillum sp. LM-5 TaxID=2681466 RepID=UPI00137D7F99|nr:4-hydroxybenzoate octaprenyltransferase [Magnetospirillum sp. LM-5]CAA7616794.1 4-hydroxybenzoate polyprenyltransferase [Magnetospirillum sp. LM-5]